jgi:hypothetical protein
MATRKAARKTRTQAKKSPPRGKQPQDAFGLAALQRWYETELDSAALAKQASELIHDFEAHPKHYHDPDSFTSVFHQIIGIFQQPTAQAAKDTLRAEALPVLLRLYDARLREWQKSKSKSKSRKDHDDSLANDLLFALKIFAMYRGKEAIRRILDAARIPIDPEGYEWSIILPTLVEYDPTEATRVTSALREPLPPGFLAVALLDASNTLAREHSVKTHPFDTPKGRERLRAFLTDKDSENFSYAHSAAASLPFLSKSQELLALAEKHPDLHVRMEAAWAAALSGDAQARERLKQWSKSPKTRSRAVAYLKELGKRPARVSAAERPELDATAEMCQWLEHPAEFGRSPDQIELYDRRRLWWPPTDDERDVWLFRYRYDGKPAREGVGMVGSITFALFGETTAKLSPEDIYGLHCCWELQQLGDPRAPKKRTAKAGRKLLGLPAR